MPTASRAQTPPAASPPVPARTADPASQVLELHRQGRYPDALHRAGAALRADPGNAELWHLSAAAAYALGLAEDAERFWSTALAHDPRHAEAHYNLGILCLERERTDEAARYLSRAILLAPAHARALNSLGALLTRHGRLEEAGVLLRRALELDPRLPGARQNLAVVCILQHRRAEARTCLDEAIRLEPDSSEAHALRAQLCVLENDEAGAERNMIAALAADPANGTAHLFRVEQRKAHLDTAWVGQLRAAYQTRRSRAVTQQIYLAFAMGKLAERLGEFDLAFEAYADGNRLYYAQHPWDERAAEQLLDHAVAAIEPGIFSAAEPPGPGEPTPDRVPIFIIGMPRSGTTLLEQILASHPQIQGCGELPTLTRMLHAAQLHTPPEGDRPAWLERVRALGAQYLSAVWSPGLRTRFAIDKMPGNYEVAGWIPLMLPQAKIIHIRRDPLDTCFSCFSTFFAEGHEYTYDQTQLGRQYERYRRWMAHWRAVLPAGRMLELDYETLVADLEGVGRAVLAHIGLAWHPDCLRFHRNARNVQTASRSQVRKPLYASSIGRWRPFERQLRPLRAALTADPPGNVT